MKMQMAHRQPHLFVLLVALLGAGCDLGPSAQGGVVVQADTVDGGGVDGGGVDGGGVDGGGVDGGTTPSLSASPLVVSPGGVATVTVSNGPGSPGDWVGLFRAGDPDPSYLDWQYLNGTQSRPAMGVSSATLSFTLPTTGGAYQLRFFANNGFTRLAVSNDVQVNAPMISATPAMVSPGGTVTVTVSGGPANPADWVGLFRAGDPDPAYLDWQYLNGTQGRPAMGVSSATLTFTMPMDGGLYQLRFFANNTFTLLAQSGNVQIVKPKITASPATVAPGGNITAAVTGGPGNPTDWVGLFRVGDPDTSLIDWQYLNGTQGAPAMGSSSATLTFHAPAAGGSYELRFFASNSYNRLAVSNAVQVPLLTASPANVVPGAAVTVTLTGGPGSPTDWVGLFRAGDPDTGFLDWQYLNGTQAPPAMGSSSAMLTFKMPTAPGTYQLRLFANNGFTRIAVSNNVSVTPAAALTVDVMMATPGQTVTVTLANGPGNPTDWIALAQDGAADTAYLDWKYLDGTQVPPTTGTSSAKLTFTMPMATGDYVLRLYANNTFTRLAQSAVVQVR